MTVQRLLYTISVEALTIMQKIAKIEISRGCEKESIAKCINFIRSSDRFNLHVDVNHLTLSRLYPAYINKPKLVKHAVYISHGSN